MSIVRYLDDLQAQKVSRGKPIHTGRMSEDHMAYRGPMVPFKSEEEYEQLTTVVQDVGQPRTFDLSDPAEAAQYAEIIEGVLNGRYKLLSRIEKMVDQPGGTVKVYAFLLWHEAWREPDPRQVRNLMA